MSLQQHDAGCRRRIWWRQPLSRRITSITQLPYWPAILAVVILMLGLGLSSHLIAEPVWEEGSHGYVMAEYPHNALNYLRFGYLRTRLGLVMDYGERIPQEGFTYRVDHPMLPSVLISFFYSALGVSAWSARLAGILFSGGIIVLTLLLARDLTSNIWTALLASFFVALSPVYMFYSRMPAPHFYVSFFALLVFFCYWRWLVTTRQGYMLGVFFFLALGAITDWAIYFVVVPILVHYLIYSKGNRNRWFVVGLMAIPTLSLVFHFVWAMWLNGTRGFEALYSKFLFRTVSLGEGDFPHRFTAREWWMQPDRGFYYRAMYWFTTPVCVLAVGWLAGFLGALLKRKASPAQALVGAMLVYGISHNLVFSNRTFIHEFIMTYHLVPVVAIAAALSVTWLISRWWHTRPVLVTLAGLLVFGLFIEQSVGVFKAEVKAQAISPEAYLVGKRLNAMVPGDRKVIYTPGKPDIKMLDNVDRPFRVVGTLSELMSATNRDTAFEALLLRNQDGDGLDAELRQYLIHNHPRTDVYGYSIFELDVHMTNVLLEKPVIQHPYQIRFGDDLEFLGFDLDPVVQQKDIQIGWLEKYFNQHAEFLPQYRTTFQVVYYWRKLQESSNNYELVTTFDTQIGEHFRIDQSHFGLGGIYPTSLWQPGQIIREEYEVELPHEYPPLKYALWVGVSDGDTNFFPHGTNLLVDDKNRVRVGEIDLQPAHAPVPLPGEAQPQTRTQVQLYEVTTRPAAGEPFGPFPSFEAWQQQFFSENGRPPEDRDVVDAINTFGSSGEGSGGIAMRGYDLNVTDRGIHLASYWECLATDCRDYDLVFTLRNGSYEISDRPEIPPSRLWEGRKTYRGEITFSPYIPDGEYEVHLLVQDERGINTGFPLTRVTWRSEPTHALIQQFGKPDGLDGDVPSLTPAEFQQFDFELPEPRHVEVLVGWTGQSEHDETRIQVFVYNADWWLEPAKYLRTLVVGAGEPSVSRIVIPRHLTREGTNSFVLAVPPRTLVGWQNVVATLIPGLEPLLRDSYVPYAGWIKPDFVQIRALE